MYYGHYYVNNVILPFITYVLNTVSTDLKLQLPHPLLKKLETKTSSLMLFTLSYSLASTCTLHFCEKLLLHCVKKIRTKISGMQ